ncbi:Uncharacterized protein C19A8.11c [Golovinomyces cichoracearum]|uniref:Uncharacterized protein C19A8.11c n=1 Tax=Golovinomyces cichoracearum TaxID=62708 RepID=A0A420IID3_9PEZI|nr:Uncharacterized protein C19A8.11c [Golovinomyces cichoracearum]
MKVTNPRRVLAVGQPGSGLLDLIKDLTGSIPSSLSDGEIAGTTHYWAIETNYYSATIPIWLDEMASPLAWSKEFLAPEAREVLQSIGAIIFCFKKPMVQTDLDEIKICLNCMGKVVKEGCGLMWDGVCFSVAMPQTLTPSLDISLDNWEDMCQEFGFEFIDLGMKGRNQFSELTGLDRLKEALEANDWESNYQLGGELDLDELEEYGDEKTASGFQVETAEMGKEMQEMLKQIREDQENIETPINHENEVEKLQDMIVKMQAVRDMSAGLPENERKRVAAKTVKEVMEIL